MDSTTYNQKRRGGFIKWKLMPSLNKKYLNNKGKGNHGGNNNPGAAVNQDVKPEPMHQTLAYVVSQDRGSDSSTGHIDSFYGFRDDEGVNMKAANYILSVRERFRLERTVSERRHQYGDL